MGFKLNIFFLFVAIIGYGAFNFYQLLGINTEYTEKNNSSCRNHRGEPGIEDIEKFGNFMVASSDDRIKLWEHPNFLFEKTPNGKLLIIDPETERFRGVEIQGFPDNIAFHPHGIYVTQNELVYVINHAYGKGGERVDVFEADSTTTQNYESFKLRYKYSIQFDDMFSGRLNDLVVTQTGQNDDEIYITTYLPFADPPERRDTAASILKKLRSIAVWAFNLKWTYVYYCKGKNQRGNADCREITHETIPGVMNNGISFDRKRNLLYTVQTLERTVKVYGIDGKDRSKLNHVKTIPVKCLGDNIFYNQELDSLTIGCLGKVVDHLSYAEKVSHDIPVPQDQLFWGGSEKIDPNTMTSELLVFQNKQLRAVSASVQYKNKVFLGSWADDGILVCDV